jgi:hypothetical protein
MANIKSTEGDQHDQRQADGHDDGDEALDRQVPVSVNKSMFIWIDDNNRDTFLRVIVTGNRPVPGFDIDTEYWYTSTDVAITEVSSVTFRAQSSPYSEKDFLSHIGGFAQAISTRQTIGAAGWTEGAHTPTGTQARLYKAVDPDDSTKWIGLLIEQDAKNALTGITWYKQTNISGNAFERTPASLTFSLVTCEGSPSTSPSDVASGAWYYAHAQ